MPITVTPLGPVFGARIGGVKLAGDMDDATFAAIRAAFDAHSVLVFSDQHLSDEEQIAFSQRFGPLQGPASPVTDRKPLLSRQSNIDMKTGELIPDDDRRMLYKKANMLWHADSTFKKKLSLCSVLTARIVPPEGGNTEFASTRAVHEALPPARQAELEDLIVEHSLVFSRQFVGFTFTEAEKQEIPAVRHRLVQVNRTTGRKSVLIGAHASHIVGWPLAKGRALLDDLQAQATRPENTLSHKWLEGDVTIWDNRACLHRGTPFDSTRYRRLMERATVTYVEAAPS